MISTPATSVAVVSSPDVARADVESVEHSDRETIIAANGRMFVLPPHLYINKGEIVEIVTSESGQLISLEKVLHDQYDDEDFRVTVYPPYSAIERIVIPPHDLMVTFCERSSRDWKDARVLEQFHYRGMGLNRIVGRRSVLIAKLDGYGVIGYGVVSATVVAAKPRFKLLKTNVGHTMSSKLINKLVRVPRIVIHPEFRGLGLGALMAHHLVQYVSAHWDTKGYKPILVEVIAAMTEYHRFFEASGFIRLGQTGGYAGLAIRPQYGKGSFAQRRNTEKYHFMVDQKPKPYLVFPLTDFVRKRVADVQRDTNLNNHVGGKTSGRPPGRTRFVQKEPLLPRSIRWEKLSVEYKSQNGLTYRADEVRESFGVDANQMYSPVVRKLTLTIDPGDTVLLTGASGCGKSTLIKLLTRSRREIRLQMRVAGSWESRLDKVAVLSKRASNARPLIDQVGGSMHEAIRILNSVGLAEAHLYLKKPRQISEGQRYRFAAARLCDSGKPVWVADEFASTLDPLTASIVAKGLRRMAFKSGATLVVAAAHTDHFLGSLLPNKLIKLRWGGRAEVIALRATLRTVNGIQRIRLVNKGIVTLQNVRWGGINNCGEFAELGKLAELKPSGIHVAELRSNRLSTFISLQVITDSGVGEMFFRDKDRIS